MAKATVGVFPLYQQPESDSRFERQGFNAGQGYPAQWCPEIGWQLQTTTAGAPGEGRLRRVSVLGTAHSNGS